MTYEIFELALGVLVSMLGAITAVIWAKVDRAEKTAEANKAMLGHLARHLDKTNELTERLSSLEASFSAEIKNLSISIKRMESAVLRLDQHRNNTH